MEHFVLSTLTQSKQDVESYFSNFNVYHLITLVVTVVAVYLSWQCSTKLRRTMGPKVGRAVLAGLVPYIYLVWYSFAGCPVPSVPAVNVATPPAF